MTDNNNTAARPELRFMAVIPARYGSSRFPGKPLAKIGGVEMIVRVCRQVASTGTPLAVATDDERIARCVGEAGFRAVMTSPDHKSGTDRIMEACAKIGADADVIINVQGDEPFISTSQIEALKECFRRGGGVDIATLARRFDRRLGISALADPNLVKVTADSSGHALYFSRSVIPYVRGAAEGEWPEKADYMTHVGVYAYRLDVLRRIVALPQSPLELAESLEQLRWLQAGYRIKVALTDSETIGIDTPSDLDAAEKWLSSRGNQASEG